MNTDELLQQYNNGKRDFVLADLEDICPIERCLAQIDLSRSRLVNANLSGADLQYANLSAAVLTRATLWRSNLTGATLESANLNGVTLTQAIFKHTQIGSGSSIDLELGQVALHYAILK